MYIFLRPCVKTCSSPCLSHMCFAFKNAAQVFLSFFLFWLISEMNDNFIYLFLGVKVEHKKEMLHSVINVFTKWQDLVHHHMHSLFLTFGQMLQLCPTCSYFAKCFDFVVYILVHKVYTIFAHKFSNNEYQKLKYKILKNYILAKISFLWIFNIMKLQTLVN